MTPEYNRIRAFVARRRLREIVGRTVIECADLLTVGIIGLLLLQLLFALVPWTILPLLWDCTVIAILFGVMLDVGKNFFWKAPSLQTVAVSIERESPIDHPYLCAALELGKDLPEASSVLAHDVVRRACDALPHLGRRRDRPKLQRAALAIPSLALFISSLFFFKPLLPSFWALPLQALDRTVIRVEPGTDRIAFGTSVRLRCSLGQKKLPSCGIQYRTLPGSFTQTRILRPDSMGIFVFALDSLTKSMEYSFLVRGRRINTDTIKVVPPPSLHRLRLTVDPPAYTGERKRVLPEGQGSFGALPGTRVQISVAATQGLKSGALIWEDNDTIPMKPPSGNLETSVVVRNGGAYTFLLIDSLGQMGQNIPTYFVNQFVDYHPLVRFLKPVENVDLRPAQIETLWIEGTDDYGIGSLALRYFKKTSFGADSVREWNLSIPSSKEVVRKELVWHLAPLLLYPGDSVFFWARIRDNKPWGTPQIARSDTLWMRIPSFAELHGRIAEGNARAEQNMSDVLDKQEGLQEKIERIVRSSKGSDRNLTWKEKEVIKDLSEEIAAQQDSLSQAMASLRETVEQLRRESGVTEEIAAKLDEVRKAVEELVEQYGDSLLFAPPEENEQVGWKEMRDALRKLEEMLPEMNERLEDALRYLEALKKDQELAMLAAQSEKLAQEQRSLADSEQSPEQLRSRQENLASREDRLLSELEEKVRNNEGPFEGHSSLDELTGARESFRRLQEESQQQGAPSEASMNAMSASLAGLSEELRSMMSSGMAQRMQEEQEMLLGMAHDALSLSNWQTELQSHKESFGRRVDDDIWNELRLQQQSLKQALQSSAMALDSFSMVPPQILGHLGSKYQEAEDAADEAIDRLTEGNAGKSLEQSSTSLRGLAQSLLTANSGMEQMMQGGQSGGGSMMSGLRKLSGKQSAINSATSELLKMMMQGDNGKGGRQGAAQAQAQAAAQRAQQAVADKLRELAETYGSEEGQGLAQRVKELEEEARRLARLLERPSQEVSERQERFLVRLLQSTLATQKQGEGKGERKSRAATMIYAEDQDIDRASLSGSIDEFHRMRLKAFGGNIPEEYRGAVEAYFDMLGVRLFGR